MRARLAASIVLVLGLAARAAAQDDTATHDDAAEEGEPDANAREPIVPAPQEPLVLGGGASLGAPGPSGPAELEDVEVPSGSPLLDQRWGDPADGRVERFHGFASFGFFGGRVRGSDTFAISPSMGLRLAFSEEVDVTTTWVLAYGVTRVRGEYVGGSAREPYDEELERVEAGNPTLTFSWAPRWESLALRIGLGFALPVAARAQAPSDGPSAAERDASQIVHDAMLGMHGGRDPWRFLPERLAFFAPARVAFGGDVVAGAIDVAAGVTVPVLGGGGDTEGIVQLAADVAVTVLPGLRAGMRGSIAAWGLGGPSERFQPALEPWARLTLGPAFATLRATLALGGELGSGSAGSDLWAIHIGGGAALERE